MRKLFAAGAIAALMTTGGIGLAQAKGPAGTDGSNGNRGLCNAWSRGSATGQANKQEHGTAFQRLAATADDAGQSVADYCASLYPNGPSGH